MTKQHSTNHFLLLDDHIVAEAVHCRQSFHGAVKDPASPVIVKSEPWEGRGPYTWGTRLLWNSETRQYDFYYVGWCEADNHYRWGIAVSNDGLQWSKPELGLETYDGRPARNMLTAGPHPDKAVRSVVRDPRTGCPPAERCKAVRFTYDGEFVSYSPDGRSWTEDPANPVWKTPSDIIHALWDPVRERFVTYYKVWEIRGETPDSKSPNGFRPVRAHAPTFEHRALPDGLAELKGPWITFNPDSAAEVREGTLLLRRGGQGRDDGGGAPLTGAWHARRVQAWAESDDWRRWHHERVVLDCDERDRPDANIQYMFVMHHGGYYLGFLTLHDERGHFEQQFAFSRDGLAWSRPWRGNFIGLGPPGGFDCGMALAPTDPILTDTQMIFYYGGFNLLHWEDARKPWSSAIGRAFLRRDGFCSWDSLPGQIGTITTQPVAVAGDALRMNADAQDGRITAELLDPAGQVIPGYGAVDGRPLIEDTSRFQECMSPVLWGSASDLGPLRGRPVRLRFRLERARLFAFQFHSGSL